MISQFRATRMEAASPFQVPARPTLALLAGDPCRNDQWEASIAKLTENITESTETWRQSKLGLRHPVRQPLGDLGPNQCEKTAVMHAIANKQLGYSPSMHISRKETKHGEANERLKMRKADTTGRRPINGDGFCQL